MSSAMSGAPSRKRRREKIRKIWTFCRPIAITVTSLVIVFAVFATAFSYLLNNYFYPVDPDNATPVVVTIPSGSGASAIAKILYDAGDEGETGLIANKAVFKIYVDFMGKSSSLQAGTYTLSRNMDIDQIVDILCQGNPPRRTVTVVIKEGSTVETIAAQLVEAGMEFAEADFLDLCRTGEAFNEYSFVAAIEQNPAQARDYLLEGYLFPDTYQFYVDSSAETVINRMLVRFNEIFTDEFIARAEEMDMSIDDVVNLASIIEKEAKTADFAKVSAVFHNRIAQNMTFGSDATIQYIVKGNKLVFNAEDLANPSLYNTYLYKGLPLGPITNPGSAAIYAALYPDEEYVADGYLYFCLMSSETGELVFAKTLAEHNANVEKYRPYW